jgi:hypothetical protein
MAASPRCRFLTQPETLPILHCDCLSVIQLAKNLVFQAKTKHIEVRFHFIRDSITNRKVDLRKVDTALNIADCLTKPLFNLVSSHLQDTWDYDEVDQHEAPNLRRIPHAENTTKYGEYCLDTTQIPCEDGRSGKYHTVLSKYHMKLQNTASRFKIWYIANTMCEPERSKKYHVSFQALPH